MSRLLALAFSASVAVHAAAGVALAHWRGSVRPAGMEALQPEPSPTLVLESTDLSGTVVAQPSTEPVSAAANLPAPVPTAPETSEPLPETPPPVPVDVVTPVTLAALPLEPRGDAPTLIERVSSRLATVSPAVVVTAVAPAPTTGGTGTVDTDADNLPARAQGSMRGVGRSDHGSGSRAAYRHHPTPDYPAEALAHRWEGVVLLHVVVDPAGRPAGLTVATSSGHAVLDAAAVSAVRRWEFEPARVNDQGVRTTVEVPIRFYLASSMPR